MWQWHYHPQTVAHIVMLGVTVTLSSVIMSHSHIVTLAQCHFVTRSYCHAVTLAQCHNVTPWNCHTFMLSWCHTGTMSHCETFILLSHWYNVTEISHCETVTLSHLPVLDRDTHCRQGRHPPHLDRKMCYQNNELLSTLVYMKFCEIYLLHYVRLSTCKRLLAFSFHLVTLYCT